MTQMKTTRIALCALLCLGVIYGVVSPAQAILTANMAECSSEVGPVKAECKTDHGACAAGAYQGSGNSASFCAAGDYPSDD
jgi:hypothetical protein